MRRVTEALAGMEYLSRVQLLFSVAVASAILLKLAIRPRAARADSFWASLLLVLPMLLWNTWAPLLFDKQSELISRLVAITCLTWVGNLKVRRSGATLEPTPLPTLSSYIMMPALATRASYLAVLHTWFGAFLHVPFLHALSQHKPALLPRRHSPSV